MQCPVCNVPLESNKIAGVTFDICLSCMSVLLSHQAVRSISSGRSVDAELFIANVVGKLRGIETSTYTDPLTGMRNRRFFDRQIYAEVSRAIHSHFISLIMLDMDGFSTANDTKGHATGDLVLKDFAGLLLKNVRKCDCGARIGGDEFALILPESDAIGAVAIANRIVTETAHYAFKAVDGTNLPPKLIRVSCGVACYPRDFPNAAKETDEPDKICRKLSALADAALYAAKDKGHGLVIYAGDLSREERKKHFFINQDDGDENGGDDEAGREREVK